MERMPLYSVARFGLVKLEANSAAVELELMLQSPPHRCSGILKGQPGRDPTI